MTELCSLIAFQLHPSCQQGTHTALWELSRWDLMNRGYRQDKDCSHAHSGAKKHKLICVGVLRLEKICDGRSMNFEFRDKIVSPKLNNIAVNIPFASRTPLILCRIVVLNVRYFFPLQCITEVPSHEVPSSLLRSPHWCLLSLANDRQVHLSILLYWIKTLWEKANFQGKHHILYLSVTHTIFSSRNFELVPCLGSNNLGIRCGHVSWHWNIMIN